MGLLAHGLTFRLITAVLGFEAVVCFHKTGAPLSSSCGIFILCLCVRAFGGVKGTCGFLFVFLLCELVAFYVDLRCSSCSGPCMESPERADSSCAYRQ